MNPPASLLESSATELLRHAEPAPVQRAEAALERAEATASAAEVATYVRESVEWLDTTVHQLFEHRVAPEYLTRIHALAMQAPLQAIYSAWRLHAPEHGVWLAYVDRLREIANDFGVQAVPLTPPPTPKPKRPRTEAPASPAAASSPALLKLVAEELTTLLGARTALDEIRTTLDLSYPELARLFGVRRQAVEQWLHRGIPPTRAADVDRLVEACRYLARRLKRERIPQIVRTPSERLGGRSMLDLAAHEGPAALLEHLRALFSFQLM